MINVLAANPVAMKIQLVFVLFVIWFLGIVTARPPVYQPNYHNQEQASHDYGYDDGEEDNPNNNPNRPGLPYRNNNVYHGHGNGQGHNRNLPYGNRPVSKRGQRPPYSPEENVNEVS